MVKPRLRNPASRLPKKQPVNALQAAAIAKLPRVTPAGGGQSNTQLNLPVHQGQDAACLGSQRCFLIQVFAAIKTLLWLRLIFPDSQGPAAIGRRMRTPYLSVGRQVAAQSQAATKDLAAIVINSDQGLMPWATGPEIMWHTWSGSSRCFLHDFHLRQLSSRTLADLGDAGMLQAASGTNASSKPCRPFTPAATAFMLVAGEHTQAWPLFPKSAG